MPWLADSILRVLRERRGEVVTTQELVAAIYANDPEGGPLFATQSVRTVIHHMRKRGEAIETVWGYRVH